MNEHKVRNIVKSLSNIKNDNFFSDICIALSRAINADFVFIAMLDSVANKASSLAVAKKGQVADNFSYALQYTPCSEVSSGAICTINCDIQKLYPDDQLLKDMEISGYVGIPLKTNEGDVDAILIALFEDDIRETIEIESLFLLFSGLIEKELHKTKYLKEIGFSKKIIENTHEAILICDNNQIITYINPSFTRITGYTADEVIGKKPKILTSERQTEDFHSSVRNHIAQQRYWQGEIWNKHKDGSEYLQWSSITAIFDEHDQLTHYSVFFYNITHQHEARKKIEFQNYYDSLTKVANKNKLFRTIEQSIKHSTLDRISPAALLVIDIDSFKKFNSLYGHAFGDKVLIKVTEKLLSVIKYDDVIARTSGDTFALFVNHVEDKNLLINLISSINDSVTQPFIVNEVTIKITLSIGVSISGNDITNAHNLFEKAEQAMFVAKNTERNSYEFYSQQISNKANEEEQLKRALEKAIEEDEFHLVYQPIISLNTNSVTKFEALIRWNVNGSYISPEEFIPAAEKFGLITKIGNIVLNKACYELKKLQEQGFSNLIFNINRSIHEFPLDCDNDSWINIIESYKLTPRDICFELTESALAPENNNHIELLKKLQLAGSTIALDDFGTGYSSLSYLRRFPIDTLKIDKSFISEMTKVEDDKILVSAIISMAKALNVVVVAEGVELEEEVNILKELGCDYIQGYYFSKPLAAELLPQYLNNFNQ